MKIFIILAISVFINTICSFALQNEPETMDVFKDDVFSIIYCKDNYMTFGKAGAYLVRPESTFPMSYGRTRIDGQDINIFKESLAKAIEWTDINRSQKMNFTKELFNKGSVELEFDGDSNGDSRVILTLRMSEPHGLYRTLSLDNIKTIRANLDDGKRQQFFEDLAKKREDQARIKKQQDEAAEAKQKQVDAVFK